MTRTYISQEIMQIFQIEREQFGMERVHLIPALAEGVDSVWVMTDAPISKESVELKSEAMSIWVPQKFLAELDEQVIVRGPRGFMIGEMTNSVRSQATQFVQKDE